ncbi:MAG: ATP-binding protein [Thermoanaerobaculia bacterium]|jgi:anti-sigma regulatory factor (Ser/Thr protein kinase)
MSEETERHDERAPSEPSLVRLPRRIDALARLFEFSEAFCHADGVDPGTRSRTDFVLEEIFTNFVKYNAAGTGDIEVALRTCDGLVEICVTDFDSERFDLREHAEVAVDAPLSERTPGGLGIHLVKKFAKRIDYDYQNRMSRITIYLELG